MAWKAVAMKLKAGSERLEGLEAGRRECSKLKGN
jgi:hypothetical protein